MFHSTTKIGLWPDENLNSLLRWSKNMHGIKPMKSSVSYGASLPTFCIKFSPNDGTNVDDT